MPQKTTCVNRHTGGLEKAQQRIEKEREVNRHTGGLEIKRH